MKKYLFGLLAIALVIAASAFMKKDSTTLVKKAEKAPNACVWFQFTGDATNITSVKNKNNWIETSNQNALCNNVNVRVCAICVKTTNVSGTAPNRQIVSFNNIYFNFTGPGGTYYAFMPGPSDLEAFRNRN